MLYGDHEYTGTPLSPREAEMLIDELRTQYGLGEAYHHHIHFGSDHMWWMTDGLGHTQKMSPVDGEHLSQWFRQEYADAISDRLETSEG